MLTNHSEKAGRIYSAIADAIYEAMYEVGFNEHTRRSTKKFWVDVRALMDASFKAGTEAIARGHDIDDVYQLVIDHVRELPAKLREL